MVRIMYEYSVWFDIEDDQSRVCNNSGCTSGNRLQESAEPQLRENLSCGFLWS